MNKTTSVQPEQPIAKLPMGLKAIDAARTVIRQSMRYQSGPQNLKGMKASNSRYLTATVPYDRSPRFSFSRRKEALLRAKAAEPSADYVCLHPLY